MSMNDELAKALNKSFGTTGRREIEQKIKQGKIDHTIGLDNQTGNNIHILRPKAFDLPDGRKIVNGKLATWNPLDLGMKVFNQMKQEIYWRNEHPYKKRPHIIHPSNKWISLPDQYYSPHLDKEFKLNGDIKVLIKLGGK